MILRRIALALLLGCVAATARAAPPWPGFQIIEWQPRTPAQLATLRGIGVTAGMVAAARSGNVAAVPAQAASLQAAGLGCYVENIGTDFYSAYHRWSPGHEVNWRFVAAQRAYRADPSGMAPLIRDPSLSDPVWLARIADRLTAHVRAMRGLHPLFYNLGDETGIADLAAFWDFDFSPVSLAGFRVWLRGQYGSLATLNAEWGSHFGAWPEVMPRTTWQAMRAPDDNLAPWADFKAWMDVAFARAVRAGTAAVHAADPTARAGLEGAQIPGWGGYDYTRLAHAADVMELYDAGENLAIVRALNPAVVPLMTSSTADRAGLHNLWRDWLRGVRGVILWDDGQTVVRADGSLGPRGQAYAPVFAELRGAVGARLAHAAPVYDPVAILYSPASFRVQWMIENRPRGDAWMDGSSEADAKGDAARTTLTAYAGTLAHRGLRPRYVTDAQIAAGALAGNRLVILPHSVALSDGALRALRGFARAGGHVVADVGSGQYDAHGRRRSGAPPLAGLVTLVPAGDRAALSDALLRADVRPAVEVDAADVETYVFREGAGTIVALQRDLGAMGDTETVAVRLSRRMRAIDIRNGRVLGTGRSLRVNLDLVTPALIALTPESDRADPSPNPLPQGEGE